MSKNTDNEDQPTLSDWVSPSSDNEGDQTDVTDRKASQESAGTEDDHLAESSGEPFTLTRSDFPSAGDTIPETGIEYLLSDDHESSLSEGVSQLAHDAPDVHPAVRAVYIYWCAQIEALPEYELTESMMELRDHVEDELEITTQRLIEDGFLTEKLVEGKWKYYRVTAAGLQLLNQKNLLSVSLLDPDTDLPVIKDGSVHNLGVRLGGDWLIDTTDATRVAQPDLTASTKIDLRGYTDQEQIWTGEIVVAEDLKTEDSDVGKDVDTFFNRIQYLGNRPGRTLLVFESSTVAVEAFQRFNLTGMIDIPGDIDYRQYSISQLREHVLPEIEHAAIDHIESVSTLRGENYDSTE